MKSVRVKRTTIRKFALLAGAAHLMLPGLAAADTPDHKAQIEEVVVTAEKRSSSVQKTPISITAITGKELVAAGITNVLRIAEQVPGISFKTGGPGQTELEMRGLNSAGGNSPTVGFYLDETPITTFAYATSGKVVLDPDLYDLNRVEVLRGPQGTLYGGGSMGGTIRLLTNQPVLNTYTGSLEAIGSGTEGGGPNGTFNLMANLPLVQDKAALRIVASDQWFSGWINRIVLDPFPLPTNGGLTRGDVTAAKVVDEKDGVNWEHLQSVRANLLLQPTEDLTITPMGMFQAINQGGQSLVDVPPATESHYEPFNDPEPIRDQFWLGSLNIKYDLGWAELVSNTAHWHRFLSQVQDGTEVLQDVLALPGYSVADGGIGNDPWTENDSASQTSEEIRLASTGTGRVQWLVGFFYDDVASTTEQYSNDPGAVPALGVATLFHELVSQTFEQKAVFGEASYQILPVLKFTAGLRYFDFDNTFNTTEYGFFGPYGTLQPGSSGSVEHDQGINPKFNLSFTPSPDLTLYATAAKGFRPGGGNEIVPTSGTVEGDACAASLASLGKTSNPSTYGPDSLWNYELGEKARFLDDRLTINSAIYYEDWNHIQRDVTLSCGYIYTDNAGKADIYGGEVEVNARVTDELTLNANFAYTDAEYAVTSLEAGVVKGQVVPDVPRITSSQSVIWQHPLSDTYKLIARATNSFVDSRQDVTYSIDTLPSYDTVGGRIGIVSAKGWSGYFFIDNAGNSHALLSAINSQVLNIPTLTRDTTLRPRTFGIDLVVNF
jgi:outer membrane receptor protein involved in Fe transport